MIALGDGFTLVRPCKVQGGTGPYAYYTGFTSDNLPEVGLEDRIRVHDSRLAGFHFKLSNGSDWIIVRGYACDLQPVQLRELEERLGLKRKEPEFTDD